jgi:branched-chain amino acid transport system substrate-binding protein
MRLTRRGFAAASLATALPALRTARAAEETVKLALICELSGGGATAGGNWRNGVDLAVAEINAKGGILGRKIVLETFDSQSNPGVARAMVQKGLDGDPYAILGPVFSGSIKVSMAVAKQAKVTQIIGGDAAELTASGNPYIFRTNVAQATAMPKVAVWANNVLKTKKIGMLWVNNDFGKGGRDIFLRTIKPMGIEIVADLPSEQGQVDFAADVVKLASSGADSAFIYVNEDESARFLIEARKQSFKLPIFGESTIVGQKVVDLAGAAANGVRGHVGLSADAPVALLQDYKQRYVAKYKEVPDHNGIKGYIAVGMVKAATEKMGNFDRDNLAATLHGLSVSAKAEPAVMVDTTWDANGDMNRETWMVEIKDGKQIIIETLPALKA